MNKIPIIKLFLIYINFPRLIMHIILYLLSSRKREIISDIKVALLHRNYECSILIGLVYLLVFDDTYRNLFYYRLGSVAYFVKWLALPHSCFTIGTYTPIGSGMLCVHPFSSIINAKAIGVGFVIKNNVTIGDSNGCPLIKDNVTINVNSVIIGDITIGNNVTVGAGSVIRKNVPDNSIVVGNPAFVIRQDGVKIKKLL